MKNYNYYCYYFKVIYDDLERNSVILVTTAAIALIILFLKPYYY